MIVLDDMEVACIEVPDAIFEKAIRFFGARKSYTTGLEVYDRLERERSKRGDSVPPPSPTLYSCLVHYCVETGEYDRALNFFTALSAIEPPALTTCMVILRVHIARKDWDASHALLRSMKSVGPEKRIDAFVLNKVLTVGVEAAKLDEAELVLGEEPGLSVADAVSYNILLKGYVQAGESEKVIRLLDLMFTRQVKANLITFNTAMDGMMRSHNFDKAWDIFFRMKSKEHGISPDACTCTVLMKSIVLTKTPAERIGNMLDVLSEVLKTKECHRHLASRMLRGVLEAAVQLPNSPLALRTFALMREDKHDPSAAELKALLRVTAVAEDIGGCHAVLLYARQCFELEAICAGVDWLVSQGRRIDIATLNVLDKLKSKERLGANGSTGNGSKTSASLEIACH
jgi:pentatricopeptide repeat protein